jgi:hypothetical protein
MMRMRVCSDDHVATVCAEFKRDKGEPQTRGWHDLKVSMFSGLPGGDTQLHLAHSRILAAT